MTGKKNSGLNEEDSSTIITTNTNINNNNNNNKDVDQKGKKFEQMEAPPDGGWGWVVVVSSFSISLLVDGVCFSFGIFFDEFRQEFDTNKAVTSWVGSVLNGSYLIVGPIVSALVNIYGCRKMTMAGGILAFAAFFISTYSPTIGVLIFTYGFLGGVGFGLMYLPAIVMVGYYFERRRALATGIACCGSGIGAFLFAPFTEYLLHEYGWRGATWILSALVFHAFLFAMFYRPLPPPAHCQNASQSRADEEVMGAGTEQARETIKLVTGEEAHVINEVTDDRHADDDKKNPSIRDQLKNQIYQSFSAQPGLSPAHRTRSMTLHPPPGPAADTVASEGDTKLARLAFSQDFSLHQRKRQTGPPQAPTLPPLQRKDIFYSGSIWHLKEFKELGSADEFRHEMFSGSSCLEPQPSSTNKNFLQNFVSIFDVSLLKSPTFLMYGLSCFLCMAGFFVPFIYMPTHAIDLGLDSQSAAFLISIIGITNTVGRVGVGFVSDQPWADCLLINNVALIIGGIATIFVPYYPEYYLLAIYAAVFGTSIAVFVSLRSIIMVELMGLEKLTTAFGFVIMCQGMSSFMGAPIAGAISDVTGNYNAAFYLAGITLTLSGVICIPLRRVARWESSRSKQGPVIQNRGRGHYNGDLTRNISTDLKLQEKGNEEETTPMV